MMEQTEASAPADQAQQMLGLARSHKGADRERLMLSIVDLCDAALPEGQRLAPEVEGTVAVIFRELIERAERDMRKALAERLAGSGWAPRVLVNYLARDEIEIARPLIAMSQVLTDDDLIELLHEAGLDHQIEVARRPGVTAPVIAHIIDMGQPEVLTALADNDNAGVTPDAMRWLVEASREVASLRAPLVRHPLLSPGLAERLYLWVGETLRAAIADRFTIEPEHLEIAIARAIETVQADDRAALPPDAERRRMERQLVLKLKAAGQLKPGYLIRALREHRLALFIAALGELANLEIASIEWVIESDRPDLLALACTAADVDRSAFSTILNLVRQLTFGHPAAPAGSGRKALQAFAVHDPKLAAAAFREAVATAN